MAGVLGVGIGVEDVRYALEPSSPGPVRPDALGRSKKPFRGKKDTAGGLVTRTQETKVRVLTVWGARIPELIAGHDGFGEPASPVERRTVRDSMRFDSPCVCRM